MVYNLLDFYCSIGDIAACDTDERHVDDAHVDYALPVASLVFVVSYRLPTRL
jgi:hypothetical protein